jgi:hypothetical protein
MDDALDGCLQRNPYVGPRPIQTGEMFLAREREARGLVNRILSSRVVLLHSPSGAGKTSLIQAAVLPEFRKRGFGLCVAPGEKLTPLRVKAAPPAGLQVSNRYVYGAVQALLGYRCEPAQLARLTLAEAFDLVRDGSERTEQLVAFDQLEEVLTLDPTDRDGQEEFFDQLGEALEDLSRWALLSIREDFMGGLDRFQKQIPGRLRSTFRLDFMEEPAAMRAVCGPAERRDVKIQPEAARHLVDDLRRVRDNGFKDTTYQNPGLYVQPVLLQVACHNLWRKRCKSSPDGFTVITLDDVLSSGRVESALRRYYDDVIQEVVAAVAPDDDLSTERTLRDWIGTGLITADEHRNQMQAGPNIDRSDEALQLLGDRYVIRSDVRDGTRWWELSHDRLIPAVLSANAGWRRRRLEMWQTEALRWDRAGREDDSYLLDENEFRAAQRSLARLGDHATDVERRFVERSKRALRDKKALRAIQLTTGVLSMLLVLSAAVNGVLLILLLR